ncbi:MAG TPA: multifunctional oxoglutarate decarboxylase/oxoglutarate dehydrogenase thiamine pyrophosphate-binding subunit/dihydrolipoyllysine-residue succinyltransferase subunit, partial [Gaiellaceae bacterium]|nr:multifunctional oxoglutarate decarboxylase/oxoglutarate dehydrogenase thiamine pyrophosphate-binding subunit/dihydrolipoyllysine-residue succinyltransferase subunit [Gaiellaceae bacterium]
APAPAAVEPPPAEPAPPLAPAPARAAPEAPADELLLSAVASAMALVDAIRTHGHLAARLDPLGSEPLGDPALDESQLAVPLTPELQARIPASLLGVHVEGETLADVLPRLREVYCGHIAYEIEHLSDHAERAWLRQAIESGRFRGPLPAEERRRLLARLAQVQGFEQYLRRAFIGQKQFSIEGLDVLVPMLDEAVELAAESGAHEVVIGIAHRGRLNVLAHVVGRTYESILREFEGERTIDALVTDPEGGTGDVKYHLAASETRATRAGEVQVTLAANPSHLEAVDPVVEGLARAEQTDRSAGAGVHDPTVAMPVLIHGDASFAGQGVVAETFNLHALDGYSTGGTLHVIANNQVGFTTDPAEGRSTRYSSDLAKGFDVPIVHVNADDPEAALAAVRLALAYREEFGHDVVVDLVGYRRFGHNEQDEPAYTQPLMAERIARQPPVLATYAAALGAEGLVAPGEEERLLERTLQELREVHERLRSTFAEPEPPSEPRLPRDTGEAVVTAVPAERLRELNEELLRTPEGFTVNEKLARQLERRRDALAEGGIDWGQAEALAFATLLEEGIPIRLSGQDTERGTFSHRHAVLHDPVTGETFTPLQRLPRATASFEIYNSPLSEYAALGFEYGYSIAAPDALVLWEAQFGDFVNGAQIVVDQFIVAGRAKWGQTSRITLLLPHGYEGNGPEHSSARLERFLQLAAQENIRIANCTTSAQYFHLLRRQALDATARPLVVMTPKGLLRLRQATSTLEELASGSFRPVLDDPAADRAGTRRLVLCSGKVYYDIVGHELRGLASGVAVARLEQLYPFPVAALAQLVGSYPGLREIVWVQEEPQNMGAWRSIRHRLEEAAAGAPAVSTVAYVGRPWRASPSEGYPTLHSREQDRIVREALGFRAG